MIGRVYKRQRNIDGVYSRDVLTLFHILSIKTMAGVADANAQAKPNKRIMFSTQHDIRRGSVIGIFCLKNGQPTEEFYTIDSKDGNTSGFKYEAEELAA